MSSQESHSLAGKIINKLDDAVESFEFYTTIVLNVYSVESRKHVTIF